jgi:O-acetyl-ADP-ribose deacetylase (regulator of RNase III)
LLVIELVTGNLLDAGAEALVNTVNTKGVMGKGIALQFKRAYHWKSRSWLADIDSGLRDLRRVLRELEIASVAVPPLGCGLGGLSWADVRPRIEDALADLPTRVLVYEPQGAPAP